MVDMMIREVRANNPAFTHIFVNDKNVGTRNHIVAVLYEDLGTREEIEHVREMYVGGGYIVTTKLSR